MEFFILKYTKTTNLSINEQKKTNFYSQLLEIQLLKDKKQQIMLYTIPEKAGTIFEQNFQEP